MTQATDRDHAQLTAYIDRVAAGFERAWEPPAWKATSEWQDFEYGVKLSISAGMDTAIAVRREQGADTKALEDWAAERGRFTRLVCDRLRERAKERRKRQVPLHVLEEGEDFQPGYNDEGRFSPSHLDILGFDDPWRGRHSLFGLLPSAPTWALRDAGVWSAYDASLRTDAELLAIKGVGRATVKALRERIAELEVEHPLVPEGAVDFAARLAR